ncbi:MAG: hypothetical protein ACRD0P_31320 [Stackebrandtia sp.]
MSPQASQRLRTLCLTCSGSGDLDRQAARVKDGKIVVGVVTDECWFCRGEGWMNFARRAS